MTQVNGTFEVTFIPQPAVNAQDQVGHLLLNKVFHGALEGTSVGHMLSISTATQGSAGYVAMEVVQGALQGRTGRFALQHAGTMDRGRPQLSVTVVPDSGTDQLVGLTGTLIIDQAAGKHTYVFNYELAAQGEEP
jgi:hypothetical protein